MKVQVTKLGVKIDGVLLGERYFEQEKVKVSRVINGRPERIRDLIVTKTDSDFYINIEALKDICKDILVIDINQEDFNKSTTKTCPQVYTEGKSSKWTGKAIAGFLNDNFNTKLFTF